MNAIVVIVLVVLVADSYAKPLKRGSGPNLWWDQFEECAGLKQSPVYLKKSIAVDQCFEDIKLTGFGTTPPVGATMTLTNNGHTVKMSLSGDYLVDGGGLGATYRAGQFHFHWGKNNDRGSEHFMDFTPHPAEMHIVTYDTSRFGSIAEAVGEDGGLAVLGFLIEVSPTRDQTIK
uniref:Carbonic anhydrase n=1 Tax=Saccoglossus kowalevskii TaxID=10224 RepID=A0ABM0MRU1_SACKO|nr:PREDICTED: carbonic anhydrase 1-like [Saccoglossus kowalevskii]